MENPAAEETEHHEDTCMSESSVEAMMVMEVILDEREVKNKGSKVRIQSMETEVEFQSEEREIIVADNEHN